MSQARPKPSLPRRIVAGGAWATAALVGRSRPSPSGCWQPPRGRAYVLERVVRRRRAGAWAAWKAASRGRCPWMRSRCMPKLHVRARHLAVDWSPHALLAGEVRVDRLHAALLEIATAPSGEPAREPSTLKPPLRIRVDAAAAERVSVAKLGSESTPWSCATSRFASCRQGSVDRGWGRGPRRPSAARGRRNARSDAPFALDAKGVLEGARGGRDLPRRADREAARSAAIDTALAGSGLHRIGPRPPRALRQRAPARAGGEAPGGGSRRFAAAPHTKLRFDAKLAPREGAVLAGPVSIVNAGRPARPGTPAGRVGSREVAIGKDA